MLVQTAEHRHYRELPPKQWWPHNAIDLWWRCGRRSLDRELLALRMLEQWRAHATFRLGGRLDSEHMGNFLDNSGSTRRARMSDKISVTPLFLGSVYRKLRANCTGPAIQVARTPDENTNDWHFAGDTVNIDGLLGHTSSNSAVITKVYDQMTDGTTSIDAGGAQRPRIVNAGTLDVTADGRPTMVFASASSNRLYRASNMGLSGSPALSIATVAKYTTLAGYMGAIGLGTTGSCFRWAINGTTVAYLDSNAANRQFTAQSVTAQHRYYIYSKDVNETVGSWACRQDGVALSQSAVTSGSQAMNISGAHFAWGCAVNTAGTAFGFLNGQSNFLAVLPAVLTGNDRDVVEAEMFQHI